MYQYKYPVINSEIKKQVREEIFNHIVSEDKLNGHELMMISVMDSCKMFRKNFRHFPNYPKFRRRIKELIYFNDPGLEDVKIIGSINNAIHRAIVASNVSIHA
jgi:hypothetical protein